MSYKTGIGLLGMLGGVIGMLITASTDTGAFIWATSSALWATAYTLKK